MNTAQYRKIREETVGQQWTMPTLRALLHQRNYELTRTTNGITSKCHVYRNKTNGHTLELWEEPKGPLLLELNGKYIDPNTIPVVNRDAGQEG